MANTVTDNRGVSGTSAAAAGEEVVVVPTAEDFEAAFDLAELGEPQDADQGTSAAAGDAGTTGDAADLASTDNGEADSVIPGTSGVSGSASVGDDEDKNEQRYKTLQGIHKKDKETWDTEREEWEEEREQLLEQVNASTSGVQSPSAGNDGTAAETTNKQNFLDSLSDDQRLQLAEYEKDFNVVSRMEGLKRDAALGSLRKEIAGWKQDVSAKLEATEATITPVLQRAEQTDMVAHFNHLQVQHPDYEQYRDDGSIEAWIASKPKYLQPGLVYVYEEGSAEDVAGLITDFKTENNILPATSNNGTSAGADITDPAKEEKRQALMAVNTGKGAINPAHQLSEDFESAFDEAAQLSK